MKYVLINPVVDSMYESSQLDCVLAENGYQRVECQLPWGIVVKEKYEKVLSEEEETIIDVRCPVAAQMVREEYLREGLHLPKIEPILLHCAREISERKDLKGYEKVITTPCKALADTGNLIGLEETVFMAWNEFERTLGAKLKPDKLDASPIPPGFFEDVEGADHSLSGEEEIHQYFKKESWRNTRLVELLYCQQGCHNGDGVSYDA